MIQTIPKTVVFVLFFFLAPSSLLVNANRRATRQKQYRVLQGNEAHQRQREERLPTHFQEPQRYHYDTGPGFPAPGFGEMGPDTIPDLVVDHHAKQDEVSVNNKNNTSPTVLQASNETTFPGFSAYDRNVNRIRMRGNTLTGNFQRDTGLNWGSYNRDRSGGNPKAGKSDKSYSYSSRGCYRRCQQPLPANSSKNSKGDDGKGGYYDCAECNGNDDDVNGGSWENSNDEYHGNGSYGGSSYPEYGDNSSSGGDSGRGNGGNTDSYSKGLCETFDVAFATDKEDSVVFLTGAANEPSAQGVAALVEIFEPPVLLSQSTGYAVTIVFFVDTSKSKTSDDKNGDASLTEEELALMLDGAISAPVALEVVGCTDAAMDRAVEYYEANKVHNEDYRRLEGDFDSKLVILRDWLCENRICNQNVGTNCELQCSTDLFYFGTLSYSEVRKAIKAALLKYLMLVDDITHRYPTGQSPTIEIEMIETAQSGGEANVIEGGEVTTREGAKVGSYIGAAAGVVALLMLLILLVRRSRRNNDDEEVSHIKLQEDDDNDTFMQEMASEGTPDRQYQSRGAHVLGENDSVYSNWTGYTRKRSKDDEYRNGLAKGRIGHHNTDVHQCSSATCEVCEGLRRQGVSFIATKAPSRPGMLPNDATREYTAEDTIAL